jgi:hypothetical protein
MIPERTLADEFERLVVPCMRSLDYVHDSLMQSENALAACLVLCCNALVLSRFMSPPCLRGAVLGPLPLPPEGDSGEGGRVPFHTRRLDQM